ncbi:hypothetical protein B0H13DRAFT_2380117 [Mycena leptocephala]|nr:hypothetical protein B0H13DRAFT_2380117 [Mycena leptocephala]
MFSENHDNGLPNSKEAGAAARYELLHRRLGNPAPPPLQPITNHNIGPATSAADLEAIRAAKVAGNFTVHVFYRTKGAIDRSIGSHTFSMSMETYLETVLALAVAHADIEWTTDQAHPVSLRPEDCALRFKNNMSIDPAATSLTLKALYQFYLNRPDKIHVTAANKLGVAKGTYLAFECIIDLKQYNDCLHRLRLQVDPDYADTECLSSSTRKWQRVTSDASDKWRKTLTLSSSVRLSNNFAALGYTSPSVPTPSVDVTFKRLDAVVSEESASLSPPCDEQTGRIDINTLILSIADRGKSKNVFKFYMDAEKNKVFVAKRFIDVGREPVNGVHVVSKSDNDVGLAKDLFRLQCMAMFRQLFMETAATKNFMEIANFEVSDAFLISIISAEPTQDSGGCQRMPTQWIIAPIWSNLSALPVSFVSLAGRWVDSDNLAMTILAFSHFILERTACTMAMVDIQGSFHADPGNVRTMVLFDPMSHTASQDSGVGDFGFTGIQDAIENHECNLFCGGLGLCSKAVLKATLLKQKNEHGVTE